jgi:hypothetical protein
LPRRSRWRGEATSQAVATAGGGSQAENYRLPRRRGAAVGGGRIPEDAGLGGRLARGNPSGGGGAGSKLPGSAVDTSMESQARSSRVHLGSMESTLAGRQGQYVVG